jgi:hypothetical protein
LQRIGKPTAPFRADEIIGGHTFKPQIVWGRAVLKDAPHVLRLLVGNFSRERDAVRVGHRGDSHWFIATFSQPSSATSIMAHAPVV